MLSVFVCLFCVMVNYLKLRVLSYSVPVSCVEIGHPDICVPFVCLRG